MMKNMINMKIMTNTMIIKRCEHNNDKIIQVIWKKQDETWLIKGNVERG